MDAHHRAVEHERLAERRDHTVGDIGDHLGPRDLLDDHGELVAAEAGDGVDGAQHAAQPVGDGDEQPVAGGVAEAVVDRLEVVQIDEQHRGAGVALLQPLQRTVQPDGEQCPVAQAGEGVVEGELLQLRLEPAVVERDPDLAGEGLEQ